MDLGNDEKFRVIHLQSFILLLLLLPCFLPCLGILFKPYVGPSMLHFSAIVLEDIWMMYKEVI